MTPAHPVPAAQPGSLLFAGAGPASAAPLPGILVFYDGDCPFCRGAVAWLLRRPLPPSLFFAPFRGSTYRAFLERGLVPALPPALSPDSLLVLERLSSPVPAGWNWTRHAEAEGLLWLLGRLSGPLRLLSLLRIFPLFLLNAGYRAFARRRFRFSFLFRSQDCSMPSAVDRARILG